jgi:dihydrofolate reductase
VIGDEWREPTARIAPGPPPLGLVVAMSENRCIGRDGRLPWNIPEDLKHFKRVTTGHAVIMGRKTHESISRPLPNRRNIVVSRDPERRFDGCEVATSLDAAITLARQTDPMPMVIGGAEIYREALPQVTTIFLTKIHRHVDGDAFFPDLSPAEWEETDARTPEGSDYTFVRLERTGR